MYTICSNPWWHHDMEMLPSLLALCEGNPPVSGGYPSQRASNAELWYFLSCWSDQAVEQTATLPVILRHFDDHMTSLQWNQLTTKRQNTLFLHPHWPIRSSWHDQMEAFSALLALCEGNSPVTGEFPTQRPVTQSLDVFFDLHLE